MTKRTVKKQGDKITKKRKLLIKPKRRKESQ